VIWRRRKRTPEELDRELDDLRKYDGGLLDALQLVRKRLGLGIDDAFERVRQHASWSDAELRHELDDRQETYVLQTATVDGMVVLKEFCHDESAFDPPQQDDYQWFEYEIDVDGRIYDVRRYVYEDDASITRSEAIVRDGDARRIARFLIEHEGVRRVNRLSWKTRAYTRIVDLGDGWSLDDTGFLLALRNGPVRVRDVRSAMTEDDDIPPHEREIASSRRRLAAAGLVADDGESLALTDQGRRMVDEASVGGPGGAYGHEWMRLWEALRTLPLPASDD
jgi:hypothetical protein